MSDNQIKISVNLDSKEFDQNFKRIMDQVNKMREATSQISRNLGTNNDANTGNFNKSLQKLQTTLSTVTDRTDTFNKSLSVLSKTLDDLSNKAQSAATATTQAATAQQTTQQQTTGGGGPTTPQTPTTPTTPGGPDGGGGVNILNQISSLAKILGTVGTAVATGGQLYKQIITYPERIAQREATMADMMSESARLQSQRRGYEMSLFGPERARALERASERVRGEKATDVTDLIKTVAAGAAGGTFMGGPVGTLIGGGLAFGGAMINDRKRSMLFDQEAYQKEMGAVFSGTYKEQLAAEKARSYQKDLAAQFLESESDRFTTLQRGFGLSDKELFMGDQSIFRRLTGPNQRYEMGDITQAMQGISAAGGTKGIATGPGLEMALQMQRNLGLTNAPQLMGRISGATGMGAESSREQIFRMFAEASRAKLELPEARQFMETATGMNYRTGGNLETITGLLSAGVQGTGLQSTRGIEAAQSAFEQFRQRTGETGGLTGQYKLAGLFSKGLNLEDAAYISNLPIDQINEDDPVIKDIIEKSGGKIKIEDLRKEMSKSTFLTKGTEQAAETYTAAKQKFQSMKPGQEGYEEAKKNMEEARVGFAKKRNVERLLPQSKPEREALIDIEAAAATGDTEGYKKAQEKYEEIKKKSQETPVGLAEGMKQQRARDEEGSLYGLEKQAKELSDAFADQEGLTVQARASAAGLAHLGKILGEIKDKEILENVKKNLEEIAKMASKESSDSKQSPGNTGAVSADGGVKTGPKGNKR